MGLRSCTRKKSSRLCIWSKVELLLSQGTVCPRQRFCLQSQQQQQKYVVTHFPPFTSVDILNGPQAPPTRREPKERQPLYNTLVTF
jgi:hypothetical protein